MGNEAGQLAATAPSGAARAISSDAPGARDSYTTTAVILHWLVAALVLALIGLGWYMVEIPRGTPERAFFYNLHKSIGLTTALVVLLRIAWRLRHPPPPLPGTLAHWQVRASHISHHLLYLCLIVMPVSGYVGSNFTRFGITYFGYRLAPWGWEDKTIYAVLNNLHVFTSYLLVALIALHVAAALKHLWYDRDSVFQRMWLRRTAGSR